jgi:drug/metabolite transporter (DMT)-like permease
MKGKGIEGSKSRTGAVAGLLLLSILWSLGPLNSVLSGHAASPAPPLETATIQFALLAIVSALWAAAGHQTWPHGRDLIATVAIGLSLFAAPAVLVALAADDVSSLTRVALFSLVPVFAVVFEPYLGSDALRPPSAALMAALAAVVGTLCIYPLNIPGSLQAGAAFVGLILAAVLVAAANCAAVRRASQSQSLEPFIAVACATAVAVLAPANQILSRQPWQPAGLNLAMLFAVQLPSLFLLFWLMRRMSATSMSTRYVLAPLVAILVDMAIARPTVGARTLLGLLLIAGGAGFLLLAPPAPHGEEASPLSLNRK